MIGECSVSGGGQLGEGEKFAVAGRVAGARGWKSQGVMCCEYSPKQVPKQEEPTAVEVKNCWKKPFRCAS